MEETLSDRVPELRESKIVVSKKPGGRPYRPPLITSQLWRIWRDRSVCPCHNGWRDTTNATSNSESLGIDEHWLVLANPYRPAGWFCQAAVARWQD